MSNFRQEEKLIQCPFNPSHRIVPIRMAKHIIRCMKNYDANDMRKCPFNATHVIKIPLMQAHILECENRGVVERDMYVRMKYEEEVRQQHQQRMQEQQQQEAALGACGYTASVIENGEDWDSDLVESTYNPSERALYMEVTRAPPPGMGKAERRKWRENEIARVQDLKAGRMPVGPTSIAENFGPCASARENSAGNTYAIDSKSLMRGDTQSRLPRVAANFGIPLEGYGPKTAKISGRDCVGVGAIRNEQKALLRPMSFGRGILLPRAVK